MTPVELVAYRCPACDRLRPETQPHDQFHNSNAKTCARHGFALPVCHEVRLIPSDEPRACPCCGNEMETECARCVGAVTERGPLVEIPEGGYPPSEEWAAEFGPDVRHPTLVSEHSRVTAVYDVGVDGDGVDRGSPMSKLDSVFLWPHKGYDEDVRMRLWPLQGRPFDVFLNAEKLREALDAVVSLEAKSGEPRAGCDRL